jgi:hypothetical protein
MESREMIRRSLAEIHEQPEAAPRSCEGPSRAHEELVRYARALERAGLCERITDARAAASMLTSAIFADAMHRDLMPNCFPQPVSAAPAAYARLYLRALGVDAARLRRPARARRAS